jgi:hypothetical protein
MKDYQRYLESTEWRTRRQMAMDAAQRRCQLCYGAYNLHVHHRTYERVGREWPTDLTVLCADCHGLFHDKLPAPPDTVSPAYKHSTPIMRWEEDFERFWLKYPERKGSDPRPQAHRLWVKHMKRGVDPQHIMKGLDNYIWWLGKRVGTQLVMQASTFLRGERWTGAWTRNGDNETRDIAVRPAIVRRSA